MLYVIYFTWNALLLVYVEVGLDSTLRLSRTRIGR